MRSIVTVTGAASSSALTTLQQVKSELQITGSTYDDVLSKHIDEASSRAEAYLGFRVPLETVSETFRPDRYECVKCLQLDRSPVSSVAGVTIDDVALSNTEYEINKPVGRLYRLDSSGVQIDWLFSKAAVIVYSGGYILPDDTDRDLPQAIEAGVIAMVRALWFGRQRDPLVKSVEVPNVMTEEYWVGSVGGSSQIPPDAEAMLAPFKRMRL